MLALNACDATPQVNVYSTCEEAPRKAFAESLQTRACIEVNLVTGEEDALLQRLTSEERNSPAGVLLTTDAGRLHRAILAGVLQPIDSRKCQTGACRLAIAIPDGGC